MHIARWRHLGACVARVAGREPFLHKARFTAPFCTAGLNSAESSTLGKEVQYIDTYDASLLFPIPREPKRVELGLEAGAKLPFSGMDNWNAYEMSVLNGKGKPIVFGASFLFQAESPSIVESKSFKLYLNSFNQTKVDSLDALRDTLQKDLSEASGGEVEVTLKALGDIEDSHSHSAKGTCVDDLDIAIDQYQVNNSLLETTEQPTEEAVHSHLLKSNCPVTNQPDWATVVVQYKGPRALSHESFLRYICSFRQHPDFHEQCVERIHVDVQKATQADSLLVYAKYTRRGGLDINPLRYSGGITPDGLKEELLHRLPRQ